MQLMARIRKLPILYLNRQRYKKNLYQLSNVNENKKSILRKYLKIVYFTQKTNPSKKYDGYAIDKIINARKLKHKNSTKKYI